MKLPLWAPETAVPALGQSGVSFGSAVADAAHTPSDSTIQTPRTSRSFVIPLQPPRIDVRNWHQSLQVVGRRYGGQPAPIANARITYYAGKTVIDAESGVAHDDHLEDAKQGGQRPLRQRGGDTHLGSSPSATVLIRRLAAHSLGR